MISLVGSLRVTAAVGVVGTAVVGLAATTREGGRDPKNDGIYKVVEGTLALEFARAPLEEFGWTLASRGGTAALPGGLQFIFALEPGAPLEVNAHAKIDVRPGGRGIRSLGGLLIGHSAGRLALGNLSIVATPGGTLSLADTLVAADEPQARFDLLSTSVRLTEDPPRLQLDAELVVSDELARAAECCDASGRVVGGLRVHALLQPAERSSVSDAGVTARDESCEAVAAAVRGRGGVAGTGDPIGPDVVVADLQSVIRFGRVGDITAYAVGTHACNLGDERASWISYTSEHPVITQSMFRLKDDRFEHIGLSWMKHGFYAVSDCFCGGCAPGGGCTDPTNGSQLGVWCSDAYSASLNGQYSNMSRRSDANPVTGEFPYPWTAPPSDSTIGRRLQVHDADIDPDLNPEATYFVEGHYVTADDAAAGNDWNNASYRLVRVGEYSPNNYSVVPAGQTQRGQPAIRAWGDTDPEVVETDVSVPGEGLFIVAAKATDRGDGYWRYEYAVQNLNSDRAAASFSVPVPSGAGVRNIGFHDVDYHSGEIYDLTDWPDDFADGQITWATTPFEIDENANALRWGTLYNFRFDANVGPAPTTVTIGLFKPGQPDTIDADTIGPEGGAVDCNGNGVPDICDVGCEAPGCVPPCGESMDCNGNDVPDECEPDCNENGIADVCDIASDTSEDCDGNHVPDECDPDCDGDGIPDACDVPEDRDQDGITDCLDHCPDTTPAGACLCPAIDTCCFGSGICIPDYPRVSCIEQGGTPDCIAAPCRDGCLLGDANDDGDLDLFDWSMLDLCLGAYPIPESAVMPQEECLRVFDFDDNGETGPADCRSFVELLTGPRSSGR